jgi:hypothetical protein
MTERNNDDLLPSEEELEERKRELEEQLNPSAPVSTPAPTQKSDNPFANILNFPTETVKLPSAKFAAHIYPDIPSLHAGEIEVEQMKSLQEEILTNKSFIEDGTVFDRLLNSVIATPGVEAQHLIEGDKNAVLTHLRINAYGADYPVRIPCRACGNFFEESMHLGEDVKFVGQDPPSMVKFHGGELHVTLPETKIEVVLSFYDSAADAKVRSLSYSKRKLKKLNVKLKDGDSNTEEVTFREKLMILMKSANGHTNPQHLKYLINNMHQRDMKFLKVAYNKYVPNVKISRVLKCPACSLEMEREVGFNVDFFWPSN